MPPFERGGAARKLPVEKPNERREYVAPHAPPKARVVPHEKKVILHTEEDRAAIEELRRNILPPPKKLVEEHEEAARKERRRAVPTSGEAIESIPHGKEIQQFIDTLLLENASKFQILEERKRRTPGEFRAEGDIAEEYMRLLAKYRRGVDGADDALREESLEELTRINRLLGIEHNALIESVLQKKDLSRVDMQRESDWKKWAADETSSVLHASADNEKLNWVRKHREDQKKLNDEVREYVDDPTKLWELAKTGIESLDKKTAEELLDQDAATEYVFAVADYNRAARKLDVKGSHAALRVVARLNHALGLSHNALVQSELEQFPGTTLTNPFEK